MTRTASIASKPVPISPFSALYQIGSSLRYLEIRVKIIAAMTPGALAAAIDEDLARFRASAEK